MVSALYTHVLNQSERTRQDLIRLEAQTLAQQQTINVLQEQLTVAQGNHELLLMRVLGQEPQRRETTTILDTHRHVSVGLPRPPGLGSEGPSLPIPAPRANAAPTPADLAEAYMGGGVGGALFDDMGDQAADRLGLSHDDLTQTIVRGPKRPIS